MKYSNSISRYQQIAVDIAGKIVSGNYREGDKIFARSMLAAQYQVSPETARRAIALLADLEIISVIRGSGCTINSVEKAIRFRKQFYNYVSISTLRKNLNIQLDQQIENLMEIKKTTGQLMEQLEHYQHINPLYPMHIKITDQCLYLGQSIEAVQLWQKTGATIVALNRSENFQISPGPYAELQLDDELYFVSDADGWQRLHQFLYDTSREKISSVCSADRKDDFENRDEL